MTPDEVEALANVHYDSDGYEDKSERLFAMLVDVAAATYESYLSKDAPDPERPETFVPSTLGGVSHGWALIQGLIENLEIHYPDANFRTMGVGGL